AKKEHSAIKEASRLKIPVIALVDTNTDPEGVDFIIPSNDDSPRAIEFVMEYLTQAVIDGASSFEANKKALRNEDAAAKAGLEKNRPASTPAPIAKEAMAAEEVQGSALANESDTEETVKKAPARKKAAAK
ncbi:30S ribosomal protein S2, partial [bacterium]|nr:30S ribosomal protein S2 [bacterium]